MTTKPVPAASAPRFFERGFLPPLWLVAVRHGSTDMTATQALSGSGVPGPSLNAAGRIEAAKAADAVFRIGRDSWMNVPRPTRILASPMVRTQETAAAMSRRLGLTVATEARLREVDFGEWEGISAEAAFERDGEAIMHWQQGDTAAPGGESVADVVVRVRAFLTDLAAEYAAQPDAVQGSTVVVTHAVAIKALVGAALGIPAGTASHIWPVPASLTILQLRVTPSGELAQANLLCLGTPTD